MARLTDSKETRDGVRGGMVLELAEERRMGEPPEGKSSTLTPTRFQILVKQKTPAKVTKV